MSNTNSSGFLTNNEKISLISVCLAFLWMPINVWYFNIDSAARIPFALLVYSLALVFRDIKNNSWIAPNKLYVCIAIYMVINGYCMGSASMYPKGGSWLIVNHILGPVMALFIVTNCARKNFNQTIKILSYGLFLFCGICFFNSNLNERGRLDSDINANEMALYAATSVAVMLLQYLRGTLKSIWMFAIVLPILLIIQTGSRMGFAMISFMILTVLYLKGDLKKPSTFIPTIFFVLLTFICLDYIFSHTVIGERLLTTTKQSNTGTYVKTGTILDYYGDRGVQYYFSWPLFLEHPIFGIGFHKWRMFSPSNLVCHSELMVQYVECGLVSFIPWVIFWYKMWKPLKDIRKKLLGMDKEVVLFLMAALLTLFYADTVLWSYNMYCVFIIYALAIAFPRNLGYEK